MVNLKTLGLLALALTCLESLPALRAVVPAPDGGYPGGNTAEGQTALLGLTTGSYNTAVGFFSLRSDTHRSAQHGYWGWDAPCQHGR